MKSPLLEALEQEIAQVKAFRSFIEVFEQTPVMLLKYLAVTPALWYTAPMEDPHQFKSRRTYILEKFCQALQTRLDTRNVEVIYYVEDMEWIVYFEFEKHLVGQLNIWSNQADFYLPTGLAENELEQERLANYLIDIEEQLDEFRGYCEAPSSLVQEHDLFETITVLLNRKKIKQDYLELIATLETEKKEIQRQLSILKNEAVSLYENHLWLQTAQQEVAQAMELLRLAIR